MPAAAADLDLQCGPGEVRFWIHVTPRARRAGVGGLRGDALCVAVKAPPLDGRANRDCLAVLAGALEVSRRDVDLPRPGRSRRKRAVVRGDPAALAARLRALAAAGLVG